MPCDSDALMPINFAVATNNGDKNGSDNESDDCGQRVGLLVQGGYLATLDIIRR
jgi:hypothetical protein